MRHEKVCLCLQTLGRRAGLIVSKERAVRDPVTNKRTVPDLKISNAHLGAVHIDVSVVGAFSKSNIHAKEHGMRQRASEKNKQHSAGAAAECATFIPFVVDSIGRFTAEAWRVIDLIVGADLAQSATGDQHTQPELTRMNIARAVAIQLQAGNADIDLEGLSSQGIPFHPFQRPHHLLHPTQESSRQQHQQAAAVLPSDMHDTLVRKPMAAALIPSVILQQAGAGDDSKRSGRVQDHSEHKEEQKTLSSSTSQPSTHPRSTSTSSSSSSSLTSSSSSDTSTSSHMTPKLPADFVIVALPSSSLSHHHPPDSPRAPPWPSRPPPLHLPHTYAPPPLVAFPSNGFSRDPPPRPA